MTGLVADLASWALDICGPLSRLGHRDGGWS